MECGEERAKVRLAIGRMTLKQVKLEDKSC